MSKKVIIISLVLIALLIFFIYKLPSESKQTSDKPSASKIESETSSFTSVVSTNPSPLEGAIILPTQTVQITFSDPVLNTDELKHTMDPEGGYDLKLSFDRKTLSIIPNPSFKLGTGYIFTIKSDLTKFDNGKKLQSDINYHFNTIEYHGV